MKYPKFSLRELLLLMIVVVLAAGWFADRLRLKAEVAKERELRDERFERLLNSVEQGLVSGKLKMADGTVFGSYTSSQTPGWEFIFDEDAE